MDGEKIVLGRDVFVPGEFTPQRLTEPRRTASVDGYDVRLRRGTDLTFEIGRGGRPVSTLQPYLGAAGTWSRSARTTSPSCTCIRARPRGRAPWRFEAELAVPGRYRLFLQFKHDGRVHTVPFTLVAT